MVVSVHGLPQAQAREASTLAERLTDPEIFVLMACLHLSKSRSERVFARRSLVRRPSVVLPLRTRGIDLGETLDSLIAKGFMNHAGFGRVQVSEDGVIIEHRFSILRAHLVLQGSLPSVGASMDAVAELRVRMRIVCDLGGLPT